MDPRHQGVNFLFIIKFLILKFCMQAYSNLGDIFPYSIISDPKRELAVQLGMIDPVEKDKVAWPTIHL